MTGRGLTGARVRLVAGLSITLVVVVLTAMGATKVDGLPTVSVETPASREATIDLATREGVAVVQGQWRYSDTTIVEVDFTGPGPGPGGLWVISADGVHLGTIVAPRHVHNMAWGGSDGRTLFLCARDRLYTMRLNIPGAGASRSRS